MNLFHFHQIKQETLVVGKLLELSQLFQMCYPLVSNFLLQKHTHYGLMDIVQVNLDEKSYYSKLRCAIGILFLTQYQCIYVANL